MFVVNAGRLVLQRAARDGVGDFLNRVEAGQDSRESGARQVFVGAVSHAAGDDNLAVADRLNHRLMPVAMIVVVFSVVMVPVTFVRVMGGEFVPPFPVGDFAILERQDFVVGCPAEVGGNGVSFVRDDGDLCIADIHDVCLS